MLCPFKTKPEGKPTATNLDGAPDAWIVYGAIGFPTPAILDVSLVITGATVFRSRNITGTVKVPPPSYFVEVSATTFTANS
jgi:hypothetical protein